MAFGPLKRVLHWGPLIALSIIKCITFATFHCYSMWWPPVESLGGFINAATFSLLSGLTLYHMICALYVGPGHVPLGWTPENPDDCQFLQYCTVCQGYKSPRSHHCRKCQRCVIKMDHHCPWINNCVGHRNHAHFTAFLLSAVLGCFQGAVIMGCTMYKALNRNHYIHYRIRQEPLIHMSLHMFVFCLFSIGLAIGVVVAVGFLLFIQVRAILRNRTGIEDWVVEKAHYRHAEIGSTFVYPYNLGRTKNWKQVINLSCHPLGDGITWPVLEGCNQYSLTMEQIAQKQVKRERTLEYVVEKPYAGSWFPLWSKGCCTAYHPPCTDEPRIVLLAGDKLLVTRWKKYWMYGEVFERDGTEIPVRVRGWFPRSCAVMIGQLSDSKKTN